MRLRGALVVLAALFCLGAAASDPAERLHDRAKEAHARALFREIRCLVCQNESIDESDADLAADLRRIVRQQVAAGKPDAEIRRYLTYRYGEFVLLKPRMSLGNAALWGAPLLVLLIGGGAILARRRRGPALEPPLSPAEEARLATLGAAQWTDTVSPQTPPSNGCNRGRNVS